MGGTNVVSTHGLKVPVSRSLSRLMACFVGLCCLPYAQFGTLGRGIVLPDARLALIRKAGHRFRHDRSHVCGDIRNHITTYWSTIYSVPLLTTHYPTCNLIFRTIVSSCIAMSSLTTGFIVSASVPAATPDNTKFVTDNENPLAVSTPRLPSLKDQLSFEHDRQRVKKAADLVKMRARKGRGSWANGETLVSSRKDAAAPTSQKQKRLRAEEVDPLDGVLTDTGCEVDVVATRTPTLAQPTEVRLADLVTIRKPRKKSEGDFVLISSRSVIVLDDFTPPNLQLDEPWEHIYGSDAEESIAETPPKGPSYADVLSK